MQFLMHAMDSTSIYGTRTARKLTGCIQLLEETLDLMAVILPIHVNFMVTWYTAAEPGTFCTTGGIFDMHYYS